MGSHYLEVIQVQRRRPRCDSNSKSSMQHGVYKSKSNAIALDVIPTAK